jgi:hypothetical protein
LAFSSTISTRRKRRPPTKFKKPCLAEELLKRMLLLPGLHVLHSGTFLEKE